jgi:sulfhydrogenase subunit alpha
VDSLTRVEGKGAIQVKIRKGTVEIAHLDIYEPPRHFEAFLRGRFFWEVPDIVSRICGICPVAHPITAVQAIENALGVEPQESIRVLRRLLVWGEWIENHALHIFLLHAPDYLGYPDAFRMAKDHPETFRRGLQFKKLGNQIMTLLGGRAIHPVTVRIGGFYRVPTRNELAGIKEHLKWACDTAREVVRWTSDFPFPDFEKEYDSASLNHVSAYPMNNGDLILRF